MELIEKIDLAALIISLRDETSKSKGQKCWLIKIKAFEAMGKAG
jgi:hypothetical protein